MESKYGKAVPEAGKEDKTIQALASDARSILSPHMMEAWIAHSPFLVNGMGSHLLVTEALQRVDREMSNVGLASLATHRKIVAAKLPARSTVANIATGLPAQSTIAHDVPMVASPHYPAELDLDDDPPIAPRP